MIQSGNNGNGNGMGGKGGGMQSRTQLRLLRKLVEKADVLLEEDFEKTVEFAQNVRGDENASKRDRIRATELLNAIVKMGAQAAVDSDKIERLDEGQATERQTVKVVYHEKPLPQRA